MRIYLDSNVFIPALEGTPPEGGVIRRLLALGDSIEHLFVTSELSLAETLVVPLQLMLDANKGPLDPDNLAPGTISADYSDLLTTRRGMDVQSIQRSTLVLAAWIRAENKGIRLPDAIHIATAEQSGCTHFLTGDKKLLNQLRRVSPVELQAQTVSRLIDEIGGTP